MSRFNNLELSGQSEESPRPRQSARVLDEALCLQDARSAFERGDFETALRLYSKVLEFNPQNPAAWTAQVRMLIELGQYDEAKLWADKALEIFPREPELLASKGVALGRGGDLQGALSFSDASIEERADAPYVWLARGDVLSARKEQRADYCFDKALMLAPRDWVTAWLAARVHCYYERFAQALRLIQQAVEWNSGHFLLWLQLGQCQVALGLVGPARFSFTQAKQLNRQCTEADLALLRLANTGLWTRVRGLWRRFPKQ